MANSYAAMAERLGIEQEEWVQPYLARRWTRRGARNFLIETLLRATGGPDLPPTWHNFYEVNRFAQHYALHLGFRIPSEAFDADRAKVLRLAAKAGVHLATEHPAVYRWAMKVRR